MKKILSLTTTIVLLLGLTACNDVESSEYNQTVADATRSMLTDYYQGMRTADFDLTFSNFPQFYRDTIADELEYYGGTEDEYISENNASWYEENYGEDATISIEVTNTELMKSSVTKKYNKLLASLYQVNGTTIDTVYTVDVDKTISGSTATDTIQEEWTILEIDSQYYLYDTYFEDIANANTSQQ